MFTIQRQQDIEVFQRVSILASFVQLLASLESGINNRQGRWGRLAGTRRTGCVCLVEQSNDSRLVILRIEAVLAVQSADFNELGFRLVLLIQSSMSKTHKQLYLHQVICSSRIGTNPLFKLRQQDERFRELSAAIKGFRARQLRRKILLCLSSRHTELETYAGEDRKSTRLNSS